MRINVFILLVISFSLFQTVNCVFADDTEIYFKKDYFNKKKAKPNILFLLENSSYMQVRPKYQRSVGAGGSAGYAQPFSRFDFAREAITKMVMDRRFDYANVGIAIFPSITSKNYSEMLYPIKNLDSNLKSDFSCIDQPKDTINKCSKAQWYQTLLTPFSDADYNESGWGSTNVYVNGTSLALKAPSSAIGLRFKDIELQPLPAVSDSAEKSGLYSVVLEGVFDRAFIGGTVKIFINRGIHSTAFAPNVITKYGFGEIEEDKSIICDIPKKKAGDMFECDVTSLIYDKLKRKDDYYKLGWLPYNAITFLITSGSTKYDFSIYAVEKDPTKAARLKIIASPDLQPASYNTRKEFVNTVMALKGQTTSRSPIVPAYFEAFRFFSNIKKSGSKGPYHYPYTWNGTPQNSPFTEDCQTSGIVLVTNATPNINNAQKDIMDYIGEKYTSVGQWGQTIRYDTCFDRLYAPTTSYTPTLAQGCLATLARWGYEHSQTNLEGNNIVSSALWFGPGVSEGDTLDANYMRTFSNGGKGFFYPSQVIFNNGVNLDVDMSSVLESNISYRGGQVITSYKDKYKQRKEIYYALTKPVGYAIWPGNLKRYGLKYISFEGKKRPILVDLRNQPALREEKDGKYSFQPEITSWWSKARDGDLVMKGGSYDNINFGNITLGTSAQNTIDSSKRNMFVAKERELIPFKPSHENPLKADDFALATKYSSEARKYYMQLLIKNTIVAPPKGLLWDFGHSRMASAFYDKCLIGKGDTPPINCDSKTTLGQDKFLEKGLKQTIFIGNTDGFFRGIDASTGQEQFAISPFDMLPKLANAVNVDYRDLPRFTVDIYKSLKTLGTKPYALDGDVVIVHDDINKDGYINNDERALAIVSAGRGGRAIYAFDISKWNEAPKIKWEITNQSSAFAELGYTWSTPICGKIKINQKLTDVLVFGGGYDPEEDNTKNAKADTMGRAIYIVDAWTGKKIWSFSKGMNYSVPASVAVITDKKNENVITDIFAGDMGGQLWRFHVDNQQSLQSNLITAMGESGVVASLAAGNRSESERRRIYQAPSVYKLEGSNNESITVNVGTGYVGHPLVTDNQDGFYSFSFPLVVSKGVTNKKLTVDDLVQITSGQENLTTAKNYSNGFYIEFASKGEKVISSVITDLGVLAFNTYVPSIKRNLSCMPNNDQQHFYLIDAVTGETLFGSLYRTTEIAGMPTPVNLYCEKQYCTVVFGSEDLMEKAGTVNAKQIRPIAQRWVKLSWTDMFTL